MVSRCGNPACQQDVGGAGIEGPHAGLVWLSRHVGETGCDRGADLGGPIALRGPGLRKAGNKALENLLVGAEDAVLTVLEVLIEGGSRDAGVGRYPRDGRIGIAMLAKGFRRGGTMRRRWFCWIAS
jgi:hypothetical protein